MSNRRNNLREIRHAFLWVVLAWLVVLVLFLVWPRNFSLAGIAVWWTLIYFLPTIVAYTRRSTWRSLALLANLFAFAILPWFVAWFFAFHKAEGRSDSPYFYSADR